MIKRSTQGALKRETGYSAGNGERPVEEGIAEGSLGAGKLNRNKDIGFHDLSTLQDSTLDLLIGDLYRHSRHDEK